MTMMRLVVIMLAVLLSLASVDSGNNSPPQKVRNVPHSLAHNSSSIKSSRSSRANVPVAPQLTAEQLHQHQVKEEEAKVASRDKRGKYTITFPSPAS